MSNATEQNVAQLAADNIRILTAAMVQKAKSGHPGGSMGAADFMHILYSEFLKFDPENPSWIARDRYFQDPGHMSPLLYSTLSFINKISTEDLSNFRQWESPTPGHPEVDVMRGIENTSGPLGQGHAFALGSAIAERVLAAKFGDIVSHKTYSLVSDGGIQEEIAYGVGRIAGHLKLNNLIMFYDSNEIQLSSRTEDVTSIDVAGQYKAWNWHVIEINGNDPDAIRAALKEANEQTEKPTMIIGKTIMGKGAKLQDGSSFENEVETHGMPLDQAGGSTAETIKSLGGDPENPFVIFDEVKDYYAEVLKNLTEEAKGWKSEFDAWKSTNAEQAAKLDLFFSGNTVDIDYKAIEQKADIATRAASGAVLAEIAKQVENAICCSADLCNSDGTMAFMKQTSILQANDFSGAFLQMGVSELTMAAVCNGMALHGGVIPFCGTFFVFSDYMKPAVRLAALMELPVKFIWTHDSFRVGEDGPTHQPIEHEAQLRLLEKMDNLEGKQSILVLRPADNIETTVAWKMALENKHAPTALVLTRQPVKNIAPYNADHRYDHAINAEKGAYVISDNSGSEAADLNLVANGSEVNYCVAVADALRAKGKKVKVVSVISSRLFAEQSAEYQASVLPKIGPTFGITVGVSDTLDAIVGPLGEVACLERFGASAPFKVLEEKFGYTDEALTAKAEAYLANLPAKIAEFEAAFAGLK